MDDDGAKDDVGDDTENPAAGRDAVTEMPEDRRIEGEVSPASGWRCAVDALAEPFDVRALEPEPCACAVDFSKAMQKQSSKRK